MAAKEAPVARLPRRSPRRARGIVLFMGLALLLALSVGALATAQTTTLELRMARNALAAEQALQAAEAALGEAERWLATHADDPARVFPAPSGGRFEGPVYGQPMPWQQIAAWAAAPAVAAQLPLAREPPRHLIEWIASFTDVGTPSRPLPPAIVDVFRITAQGGGGTVLVQTTFGRVRGGGSRRFSGRLSWVRLR